MKTRIITALFLAPIVICLTLYLPTLWLNLVLLGIMILGLHEWNQLTANSNSLFVIGALALGILTWGLIDHEDVLTGICVIVSLLWACQFLDLIRNPLTQIISPKLQFSFGALYLFGFWAGMILIHKQPEIGPMATIAVLVTVWAADSFAFFAGKNFGRTKLAPKISPNKTIEGVVGGLAGVCMVSLTFGYFLFAPEFDQLLPWIIAGLCAGAISVVGDLYQSRLKRIAGVKDSGTLLPGHGGVLDRIDGLIAAVPVFLTIWVFIK